MTKWVSSVIIYSIYAEISLIIITLKTDYKTDLYIIFSLRKLKRKWILSYFRQKRERSAHTKAGSALIFRSRVRTCSKASQTCRSESQQKLIVCRGLYTFRSHTHAHIHPHKLMRVTAMTCLAIARYNRHTSILYTIARALPDSESFFPLTIWKCFRVCMGQVLATLCWDPVLSAELCRFQLQSTLSNTWSLRTVSYFSAVGVVVVAAALFTPCTTNPSCAKNRALDFNFSQN